MRIGCFVAALLFLAASSASAQWGVESLGNGCGGSGGVASLGFAPAPRLGITSRLRATNLPAATHGLLHLGLSAERWSGIALPVELTALGMPGCSLQVAADVRHFFLATGGSHEWRVTVPAIAALQGRSLHAQVLFVQAGLNAPGIGVTNGVSARLGPPDAPTASVTQISQWGIRWQFAQPTRAGQFANGDWFVVGPATIADISPRTASQSGRVINGSMINPNPAVPDQGYDSTLYNGYSNSYRQSLNVAWGVSPQRPLVLQPDQSLITAQSFTGTGQVPQIRTAAVLTCLSQVPVQGAFRPAYSGNDKTVRHDQSQLDWGRLRRLAPAPGAPAIATVAARFERVWLDHCPGWLSRMMHPIDNMPDYGRDLSSEVGQAALMLNLELPEAEKRELLIRLVQLGIDNWGNVSNGCTWHGNGGHDSGRKFPILFAGAMLRDEAMLRVGHTHGSYRAVNGAWRGVFGEDGQTFFVAETAPNVFNWGHGGYRREHRGLAEWGFQHVRDPSTDVIGWNTDPYRRCCTANAWVGAVLACRIMDLVAEWNHPPLFAYQDRYMAREAGGWNRSWLPWCEAMWDRHRAQLP